jgi:hypothetical protein
VEVEERNETTKTGGEKLPLFLSHHDHHDVIHLRELGLVHPAVEDGKGRHFGQARRWENLLFGMLI